MFEYIADEDNMNEKILHLLNQAITPYLTDFQLKFDEDIIDLIIPNPDKVILRKNE